jgi:hypothetical protein
MLMNMLRTPTPNLSGPAQMTRYLAIIFAILCVTRSAAAQRVPLISGGVGTFTSTEGGSTSYLPIAEPLLALPIGNHLLIESRASLVEPIFPDGHGGYSHTHSFGLTYLQADFLASPHLTVVVGSFLIPFGTYNERLSPLWINNLQDGPLISSLGLMSTGTGLGGMVRGSAISHRRFSIDYKGYFSARSAVKEFKTQRSAGGQLNFYFPIIRLEIGLSENRLLQNNAENFRGGHVWWEPKNTSFRLRSEYARGQHAQGYWIEADYRTRAFGGPDSWVGRIEPIFRLQQTFRRDTHLSDGLPLVDTQRVDFGLDYNLPHNTRVLTSYSRKFAPNGGNENIWETGVTYRFLFPVWKGK